MGLAEQKKAIKLCFLLAICTLLMSELLFLTQTTSLPLTILMLTLFFLGFSLLEGFLPSLVSRAAPKTQKGGALGIYSCAQFLGIFAGGMLGGFLYGYLDVQGIYFFCIFLCFLWLTFAFSMQSPPRLTSHLLTLSDRNKTKWAAILSTIENTPEVIEVGYITAQCTFHIKMHDTPSAMRGFLQLKETVES